MNPQEQRIAIAVSQGYAFDIDTKRKRFGYNRPIKTEVNFIYDFIDRGSTVSILTFERLFEEAGVPDYLNDLNAMHEVEKTMNATVTSYHDNLAKVLKAEDACTNWFDDSTYQHLLICAPASARAEAFLRTIGKWRES